VPRLSAKARPLQALSVFAVAGAERQQVNPNNAGVLAPVGLQYSGWGCEQEVRVDLRW
jgi:hypothetical protein